MMNKFVAMTAVSIFATAAAHGTAIANSGAASAADITTTNPSFEADAPADGESKNSSAGGWMVAGNGTGLQRGHRLGRRAPKTLGPAGIPKDSMTIG